MLISLMKLEILPVKTIRVVDNDENPCTELGIDPPDHLALSLPDIDLGFKGDES